MKVRVQQKTTPTTNQNKPKQPKSAANRSTKTTTHFGVGHKMKHDTTHLPTTVLTATAHYCCRSRSCCGYCYDTPLLLPPTTSTAVVSVVTDIVLCHCCYFYCYTAVPVRGGRTDTTIDLSLERTQGDDTVTSKKRALTINRPRLTKYHPST